MTSSAQQSLTTIDAFIQSVNGGHVKAADGSTPLSEPGSIGGETSHPVKTVDDRLEQPKEGERSKENVKDVKEDQGKPSVENAAEAKAGSDKRAASVFDFASQFAAGRQKKADGAVSHPGSAEEDQVQIGPKKAPTGEDPSVETSSAKAGKEDPGSTHPARTDNDKIDGHKWASDSPLEKLASAMKEVGDNLCAQIAWVSQQDAPAVAVKAAAHSGGKTPTAPAQTKQAEIDPYLAQQLGWEMAGLINGTFDKKAADSLVVGTLEEIVKTASADADRYIQFMANFLKSAEGGPPPDAGAPPPGAGGPPPGAGGGADPSAMMSALGGGADAGGGAPPPGAGGPPPGAGGPPGMGGGADPEAMQLAQILEQLGISPEELEEALQQAGGPGGGGAPPGAGGPPPGAGGPPPGAGGPPPGAGAPGGMETQASDKNNVHQKQAESDKFAQARSYITEIVQRSRARRQ